MSSPTSDTDYKKRILGDVPEYNPHQAVPDRECNIDYTEHMLKVVPCIVGHQVYTSCEHPDKGTFKNTVCVYYDDDMEDGLGRKLTQFVCVIVTSTMHILFTYREVRPKDENSYIDFMYTPPPLQQKFIEDNLDLLNTYTFTIHGGLTIHGK